MAERRRAHSLRRCTRSRRPVVRGIRERHQRNGCDYSHADHDRKQAVIRGVSSL